MSCRALLVAAALLLGAPAVAEVALCTWSIWGQAAWARATTGVDGRAVLPPVPAGSYRVIAWREDTGRAAEVIGLPARDDGLLSLRLPAARTVSVEVVHAGTEEPVADVRLEIWERLQGNGWVGESTYLPLRDPAPTDRRR